MQSLQEKKLKSICPGHENPQFCRQSGDLTTTTTINANITFSEETAIQEDRKVFFVFHSIKKDKR